MALSRIKREKEYPKIHYSEYQMNYNNSAADRTHAMPIAMHDEGLAAPSTIKTNPNNDSFAEYDGPNCHPESEVGRISAKCEISMTSNAIATGIRAQRVGFIEVYNSFGEDMDQADNVTGDTVKSILELVKDTVDKQCYFLHNGTNVAVTDTPYMIGADYPGLAGDQKPEEIDFDINKYYAWRKYYSTGGLAKTMAPKLVWKIVTPTRPATYILKGINKKIKRMNPYAFCGLIILVPHAASIHQFETSATAYNGVGLKGTLKVAFPEWNPRFDSEGN